jgi:predicted dinucleotide-binding enzyme
LVVAGDDPEASESAIVHLSELGTPAQAAGELAVVAYVEGPSRHAGPGTGLPGKDR